MNQEKLSNFCKEITSSRSLPNSSVFNLLLNRLLDVTAYVKSKQIKLELIQRKADFMAKGWSWDVIIGEDRQLCLLTLEECMKTGDKIADIQINHIKVTKSTGETQYYERRHMR